MRRTQNRSTGSRKSQSGATLVEASLTAVIFFTVLFGIVGFGRVIWAYSWTAHAAREGSRWASVRGSKSPSPYPDVATFVKSNMMGLDATAATVLAPQWIPDNNPGSIVEVTVQYRVSVLVPFVPQITVGSTSRMPIAQ